MVVAGMILVSVAVLPALHALEVWIIHNPRPAHPLHLLFVWLLGATVLWATMPILSLVPFWSLSSVIGGASANLLYRLTIGPVPDYIPFPAGAYGNLADVAIIGGLFVFIAWILWKLVPRRRSSIQKMFFARK